MNKKFILMRYPHNEQYKSVPDQNLVFDSFTGAVLCLNGMLNQEGRHRLPEDTEEQALTISLDKEIVELWIAETRPIQEVNQID